MTDPDALDVKLFLRLGAATLRGIFPETTKNKLSKFNHQFVYTTQKVTNIYLFAADESRCTSHDVGCITDVCAILQPYANKLLGTKAYWSSGLLSYSTFGSSWHMDSFLSNRLITFIIYLKNETQSEHGIHIIAISTSVCTVSNLAEFGK